MLNNVFVRSLHRLTAIEISVFCLRFDALLMWLVIAVILGRANQTSISRHPLAFKIIQSNKLPVCV
jgi:hypothetical protein